MSNPMLLPLRILLWAIAATAVFSAALAVFIAAFDWNRASPWVVRQMSSLLQRTVQVKGHMQLSWVLGPESESSYSRFLPRLRLVAHDVSIGNPEWASAAPYLARADVVDMSFSPLPLLHKHWLISNLRLGQADIVMERSADRRKSWRFTQRRHSPWSFDVRRLTFDRVLIRYVDRVIDLDLHADTTPLSASSDPVLQHRAPDLAVKFSFSGSYRNAPVSGTGQGGALLGLLNERAIYPVQASGDVGKTHAIVDGKFINPHRLIRADLRLTLSGSSLADLYPLIAAPLPATRGFLTKGRLSVSRTNEDTNLWRWDYHDFSSKIGHSDIAGDAYYLRNTSRPLLHASVTSQKLYPADFAPAAGNAGKVFSSRQFSPEKWNAIDIDVSFSGKKIERLPGLSLNDASGRIALQNSVLSVAPFDFGMAGGKISGALKLDGRQQEIRAQLNVKARHVKIKKLFPALETLQAGFGELNGEAALTGAGNSVTTVLATTNGKLNATVSQGAISKFILEAAGMNVADAIFARLYRDKQVHLNCAAGDIEVEHGQVNISKFIVDTDDAVIDVSGGIDLGQEQLDLNILPKTRELRLLSLRTPLYVTGNFRHPQIGPRKGPLLARAGTAAALALVTPLAALLPLISPGQTVADDCPAALARAGASPDD